MACQSCAERRERMKAWLTQKAEQAAKWARVRGTDGKAEDRAVSDRRAARKVAKARPATGGQQASPARAEHQQRGVEADTGTGAGEGRVPVSRVRKPGRRK